MTPTGDEQPPQSGESVRLAAVFADIAAIAERLRAQTGLAAAETERTSLGVIDSLKSLEPRLAALRCLLADSPAPLSAAIDHLQAISDVIDNTCAMVLIQDFVRQRLGAVAAALTGLHGECHERAVQSGGGADVALAGSGAMPLPQQPGAPHLGDGASPLAHIAHRFDAISVTRRPVQSLTAAVSP